MPNEPDSSRDLAWLAFRYVAGEMKQEEVDAFEASLEHDQTAREALAEAVEIAGAVALVAEHSQTLPIAPIWTRPHPLRSAAWMLLGAAACLALMLLVPRSGETRRGERVESTALDLAEPVRVALTWSRLRDDQGSDPEVAGFSLEGEPLAWLDELSVSADHDLPAEMPGELIGDIEPEPTPPAWMIEAVDPTLTPREGL